VEDLLHWRPRRFNRDGQMKGDRITILEASKISGGALDGAGNAEMGWPIRGGREMEDHFECLWDDPNHIATCHYRVG
jgi:myosin-crossreactive antigen